MFSTIHLIQIGEDGMFLRAGVHKIVKWILRVSIVSLIISCAGLTFAPTTKEMLLIYAGGGSIEYIKNNETAKQLPDKCIQAIDALLDEYINEEK